MIVRTEFSYRAVFGPIAEVVARLPPWGGIIADSGCWGHVPFSKACKAVGKRAVLGRRVSLGVGWAVVVPRSPQGLRALYSLPPGPLDPVRAADEDWAVLVPGPTTLVRGIPSYVPGVVRRAALASVGNSVAFSDNLYPTPADQRTWELMLGPRLATARPGPRHILTADEMVLEGAYPEELARLKALIESCDTPLPKAENIRFPVPDPQLELNAAARAELIRRGFDRPPYRERLEYELRLIEEKKFADYFLVIADMMRYAKRHMLVGPARGSSCGSLVCWMLRITEVDPIKHELLFERFIDLNRFDLPDIDIDFADDKRHLVIEYLAKKYGAQNVAQIGSIMRYKPKSALTDVAKNGAVPLWELDQLKDVMIERSSGDMRYTNQLADTLEQRDVGKALLKKYPVLIVAARLENHARNAGTHAAGIIVCNRPVNDYCGVEEGIAQVDKKMAETLNMLKIDALGLRTLSVIAEACELIKKPMEEMYDLPLDDGEVFAMLNRKRYSAVFQFEGPALRSVAGQIKIDCFDDIAAITALARPGPLSGGETQRWIKGKSAGRGEPLHPALEPFTRDTYGTIVYQESVMRVCREVGGFSWADTAKIRKLMSNREGNEAFGKFGEQFCDGAMKNGVPEQDARKIWKAIDTMGSWCFNKSHAVAYGIVSYWTAWLKTHHPVEFAVANLRHARDDDAAKTTLRELIREGAIEFIPVDRQRSTDRWEFSDGALLGPLTGIPGCGAKTAREILRRRENGIELTPRQKTLLGGESRFADYAPARNKWGRIYDDPGRYFKTVQRVYEISEVNELTQGNVEITVIGKLVKKNVRDLNDDKYLIKRNGKRIEGDQVTVLFLNIEDDTGQMLCRIGPKEFERMGKKIVDEAALGAWFAVKGRLPPAEWDFKMLFVENLRWLDERTVAG